MPAEQIFIELVVLLFFGWIIYTLSQRLHLPHVLLLLLFGAFIGTAQYNSILPIDFSSEIVRFVALLAAVSIIFVGCTNIKLKHLDRQGTRVLWFILLFTGLCVAVLAPFLHYYNGFAWLAAIVSALILSGPASTIIFPMFKGIKGKAAEILTLEAALNPQLELIIPLFIVDFMQNHTGVATGFIDLIKELLPKLLIGLGVGLISALFVYKFLAKSRQLVFSSLSLFVILFVTYALAKLLNGSAMIAIVTFAVIISVMKLKNKAKTLAPLKTFSEAFFILTIILFGLSLDVPWQLGFFIDAFVLLLVFVVVRWVSVLVSFHDKLSWKDSVVVTLTSPKGIAPFFTLFLARSLAIPGIDPAFPLMFVLLFILTILGSVVGWIVRIVRA